MKAKRIHLMISIFFSRKELGKRDQRLELKIVSSIFDTKFFKSDAKKVFSSSSVIDKVRVFEKIRSSKKKWSVLLRADLTVKQ